MPARRAIEAGLTQDTVSGTDALHALLRKGALMMPRIKFYHTQRPYRTLKNRLPYQVEEAFMGNK